MYYWYKNKKHMLTRIKQLEELCNKKDSEIAELRKIINKEHLLNDRVDYDVAKAKEHTQELLYCLNRIAVEFEE